MTKSELRTAIAQIINNGAQPSYGNLKTADKIVELMESIKQPVLEPKHETLNRLLTWDDVYGDEGY